MTIHIRDEMSTTTAGNTDLTSSPSGFQAPAGEHHLEQLISDWAQGRLWHADTPAPLKRSDKRPDEEKSWQRWSAYLAKRKPPAPFVKFPMGTSDPLVWGVPNSPECDAGLAWRVKLGTLLAAPTESPSPRLEELLEGLLRDQFNASEIRLPDALRLLTVGYWLPQLAAHLPIRNWWRLLTHLMTVSRECQLASPATMPAEEYLVATLLGGELPLVISSQVGELKPARELRSAARIALSESLCEATDGEGVIAARLLEHLPALFSSWTRCRALGRAIPKGCWTTDAETQYEWLVRQTILLARANGSPLLTTSAYRNWPGGPVDAAISLAGDRADRLAAAARFGKLLLTPQTLRTSGPLPDPSLESEWSCLAVMSTGVDSSAHRFAIDYSGRGSRIELEISGKTVMAGEWQAEITLGGRRLEPTDDWEQQCWFSNEECDYLELTTTLTAGARLERQILLGKEDEFLFLQDILHSEQGEPQEWAHTHRLPLVPGMTFLPEKETRDGVLANAKGRPGASLMPLGLGEWRVDLQPGELEQQGDQLVLGHRGSGRRASAPIWFDLRSKRTSKPRTWRQLTVAASLEVVPRDVAVGYRVQCGSSQWLIYRSLAPPANRTVLGQNTAAETLVARFLRTGEADVLVEVDPA